MRIILSLLLAAGAAATARAQAPNPFGRNEPQGFNLGLLGAQAEPVTEPGAGRDGLAADQAGLRIVAVDGDGLAHQAGLRAGDIIGGVGTTRFPRGRDPVYLLMEAMEALMSGRRGGRLPLAVLRGGQWVRFDVALPGLGPHASRCPEGCRRCAALMEETIRFLVLQQRPDGSFPTTTGGNNGLVVVTAICGLALMAAGGEPTGGALAEPIRRAKDFLVATAGEEGERFTGLGGGANWSQVNWSLGYGAIFLAEYLRHANDGAVRTRLTQICRAIEANQEANGGWAHGPGGANALGYTDFAAVTNVALAGYGAAGRVGIEIRQDTIERGIQYLMATSSGDGGIGYSQRPGQQGMGDAGRTGAAILAFALCGQERHPFFQRMADYFVPRIHEVPEGHASPVYHFGLSALACWTISRAWDRFLDQFRLELIAARRPDGSFLPRPSRESASMGINTDRSMGPCWATGTYLLVWNLPRGRLFLYGPGRRR